MVIPSTASVINIFGPVFVSDELVLGFISTVNLVYGHRRKGTASKISSRFMLQRYSIYQVVT
jgi:hypothetical protein